MRGININIMRRFVSTTHRASSSVETLKFHGGQRTFFPAGRYSRSSSSENLSRSPFLRGRSTEICEIGNFFFFTTAIPSIPRKSSINQHHFP